MSEQDPRRTGTGGPTAPGRESAALADEIEARLLGGPRVYRRAEVARLAGVTPEATRDLWRALGFSNARDDDMVFTEADVGALRVIGRAVTDGLLPPDAARGLARACGRSSDRMAMWQVQVLRDVVSGEDGLGLDQEDAERTARLAADLADVLEPLLVYVWRRNLSRAVSRLVADSEPQAPMGVRRTVGFADLVSFTRLVRQMSERELAHLVDRFESLAADVVSQHGGALVKTVGDEVLFTHQRIDGAARIALQLQEEVEADDVIPHLRVGLSHGRVLARQGDVYGDTVNRAARLTSAASPGGILVDHDVAWGLSTEPDVITEELDPIDLPGLGVLRPWRLERATEVPGGAPELTHDEETR